MQIQYSEEGIFIDFIEREDLKQTLQDRIAIGKRKLMAGTAEEMATYLGNFYGKEPLSVWIDAVAKRIDKLELRLTKVKD